MTTTAGLSLEQSPPFSVPLRFFLTAPWFLVLAGLLMLWQGPAILTNRWSPATLALTHLLTLGFMAEVMLGALLQMLPVAVGVMVPRPLWVAASIHLLLTLGTLALVSGFLGGIPLGFQLAFVLLALAFGVALVALHLALWRAPIANGTVIAMRCALAALLVTVGLGLTLAGLFAWGWSFPAITLTDLHAVLGLLGWTVLLVAGSAYQVVPMFQITRPYPHWFVSGFAPSMAGLLTVWSILMLGGWRAIIVAGAILAAGITLFAGVTLYLLAQRRRKVGDATLNYWRVSMASLATAALLWLAAQLLPTWTQAPSFELLLGILLIFGFAVGVINGMLYKIVPFLAWFHLQAQLFRRAKFPNMKQLLPDTTIRRQWLAYLGTLVLLLAAVLAPAVFTYPAGLALILNGAWLGINLTGIWRTYRRTLRQAKVAKA